MRCSTASQCGYDESLQSKFTAVVFAPHSKTPMVRCRETGSTARLAHDPQRSPERPLRFENRVVRLKTVCATKRDTDQRNAAHAMRFALTSIAATESADESGSIAFQSLATPWRKRA